MSAAAAKRALGYVNSTSTTGVRGLGMGNSKYARQSVDVMEDGRVINAQNVCHARLAQVDGQNAQLVFTVFAESAEYGWPKVPLRGGVMTTRQHQSSREGGLVQSKLPRVRPPMGQEKTQPCPAPHGSGENPTMSGPLF